MADKMSKDGAVFFNDAEHKYTDKNGNRLLSITQLIGHFKEKFDSDGTITEKYAKKHGLTVDDVKANWKKINEDSCNLGTNIHVELENYVLTGEIRDSEYSDIVKKFSKYKFEGKLKCEVLVHSLDLMIAGLVDLIEVLPNNEVSIYDYKSNKELSKVNKWGKKMLHCLWHLDDANFNHYTLQMSLYAYLCELRGLKIKSLKIFYINRKTNNIEVHPVKYEKELVEQMLKYKEKYIKY